LITDRRKRVLLIEDEFLIAMDMQTSIEEYGCIVVGPARSGSEAIALIVAEPIDAAFLDLILGGEQCDFVAEELDAKGIAWALSSALSVHSLHARYQSVPLLTKPFAHGDLCRVLDGLLKPSVAN
jgi:CheY-like chemotaxis protein